MARVDNGWGRTLAAHRSRGCVVQNTVCYLVPSLARPDGVHSVQTISGGDYHRS
jgi:hypothetical protein